MKRLTPFIVFLVIIFTACKKEEAKDIPIQSPGFAPATPLIDPELAPYIDIFKEEAEKRGLNLPFTHLEAYIVENISNASESICGRGWSDYYITREPRIEIEERCWENLSVEQRKVLVFHELGHAILDRGHLDSKLYNGSGVKSVMCSSSCRGLSVFYDDWPLNNYYLDELFNVLTPSPDFIKKSNIVRTVFEEDFKEDIESRIEDWTISLSWVNEDTDYTNFIPLLDSLNSKGLGLYIGNGRSEGEIMNVRKEINLSDFNACSNLKASANIDISSLQDGYLEMYLELNTKDEFGFSDTYYYDFNSLNTADGKVNLNKEIDLEVFCITERLETVELGFRFSSSKEATVYIKEVKLDLVE